MPDPLDKAAEDERDKRLMALVDHIDRLSKLGSVVSVDGFTPEEFAEAIRFIERFENNGRAKRKETRH